jgi:hypothetical protein
MAAKPTYFAAVARNQSSAAGADATIRLPLRRPITQYLACFKSGV